MERSIKELLILTKAEFINPESKPDVYYAGLCIVFDSLAMLPNRAITLDECTRLNKYLKKRCYTKKRKFDIGGYYWDEYLKEPRIEWLDRHIEKDLSIDKE